MERLKTSHGLVDFFIRIRERTKHLMNAGMAIQNTRNCQYIVIFILYRHKHFYTRDWNNRLLFILAKHVISYDNSKWRAGDFIVS